MEKAILIALILAIVAFGFVASGNRAPAANVGGGSGELLAGHPDSDGIIIWQLKAGHPVGDDIIWQSLKSRPDDIPLHASFGLRIGGHLKSAQQREDVPL